MAQTLMTGEQCRKIWPLVSMAWAVLRVPTMKTSTVLALLSGVLLFTAPAAAQEIVSAPPPPSAAPDGARFRIGVAAMGGASIESNAPSFQIAGGTASAFGLQLEIGAQLNHRFGIFAAPECSAGGSGFGCRLGLMGDLTFDSGLLSVGAGPEVGFLAFASEPGDGIDAYNLIGGRARLALHLFERTASDKPRQRALTIGLDVHVDHAGEGEHEGNDVLPSTLLVAPMLTVGYVWF